MNKIMVNFDDIKIKSYFKMPNENKINQHLAEYSKSGELSDIVINKNKFLEDGYISYLILKSQDFHGEIEVYENMIFSYKTGKETKYIYGYHPGDLSKTIYVWRCVNINSIFNIGEMAAVQTKHGIAPIIITKIECSNTPPVNRRIKRVVGKWKGETSNEVCS